MWCNAALGEGLSEAQQVCHFLSTGAMLNAPRACLTCQLLRCIMTGVEGAGGNASLPEPRIACWHYARTGRVLSPIPLPPGAMKQHCDWRGGCRKPCGCGLWRPQGPRATPGAPCAWAATSCPRAPWWMCPSMRCGRPSYPPAAALDDSSSCSVRRSYSVSGMAWPRRTSIPAHGHHRGGSISCVMPPSPSLAAVCTRSVTGRQLFMS